MIIGDRVRFVIHEPFGKLFPRSFPTPKLPNTEHCQPDNRREKTVHDGFTDDVLRAPQPAGQILENDCVLSRQLLFGQGPRISWPL